MMKKIGFLFILVLSLHACGIEDDESIQISDTLLPFESVSMPSEFVFGQLYFIEYTYYRPSTCHHFVELLSLSEDVNLNTRTIAVRSRIVTGNEECVDFQDELITTSFDLTVDTRDTYIYKFWHGKDANGQDVYLEMEVPVIE